MRLFIGIDFPEEVKNKIYQLAAKLQKKYPEVKWEKKENLHLTLKFLGNIKFKVQSSNVNPKPEQVRFGVAQNRSPIWFLGKTTTKNSTPNQNKFGPGLPRNQSLRSGTGAKLKKIIKTMEKSAIGVEPFEIKIGNLGYFLQNSLIIWLRVIEKSGQFEKLVKSLDREMGKLGFKGEKRAFHPHVTLGRKKRTVPVGKWRKVGGDITRLIGGQAKLRNHEIEDFRVRKITLFESKLSREGSTYKVLHELRL